MPGSQNGGYEEEVLFEAYPSRRRFIPEYLVFFVFMALGLIFFFDLLPFSLPSNIGPIRPSILVPSLFIAFSLLPFLYVEVRRHVEHYIISKSGVYEEVGYFDKRSTNLPFAKIERCEIEETFLGRILSIGDVRVDAGRDFFVISGVSKPKKVRNAIRNEMSQLMESGNEAMWND